MVAAVAPGRFYGSSLPRPRFYSDVKLNDERVDPPVSVMDPLLSWANDAHWSMGGLSFKRHRLQGRIEGSVKKLRAQQERVRRNVASPAAVPKPATERKPRAAGYKPQNLAALASDSDEPEEEPKMVPRGSPSPDASVGSLKKKSRIRRLGEEFERIAAERPAEVLVEGMASRTRSRRVALAAEDADGAASSAVLGKKRKEVVSETPRRTSPRKKQAIWCSSHVLPRLLCLT